VTFGFNPKIHLSGLKLWVYAKRIQHPGTAVTSSVLNTK
jgi:hypothetical protein